MLRYSMLIQWSDTENVYTVTFPDVPGYQAQGDTYEEAARSGREVLEQLIESGEPIPEVTQKKPKAKESKAIEIEAKESKAIEIEDKEAKRQREREKHENYIAWLQRETDRMNDERMGIGYSQFVTNWIDEHNGNGDGMEDAWKQTDAYKTKREERRQRFK